MRIQIEIDKKGEDILRQLEFDLELGTHKELFNNAVTILHWAVRQRQEARSIVSLDERSKNYRELSMPVLDRVKVAVAATPAKVAAAGA